MSYHTNAILNPLPRLGARSVGTAGFGAFGLGASPDPTLTGGIIAVARKFPNAKDGEVLYVAVAGTPGLSPTQVQSITVDLLAKIVATARQNPSWSTTQVISAVTATRAPPVLHEVPLATLVATMTRKSGPAAGAFLKACMTDPVGTRDMNTCAAAAEKQVGTLVGDQLSFYNSCLLQKASDMPVMVQHGPCYQQAKMLSAGAGPPPPGGAPYAPPPDASVVPADDSSGGLMSNKWVWIGGAVAFGGLAWVLLKKPTPAHA